jgi:hypothetical protein
MTLATLGGELVAGSDGGRAVHDLPANNAGTLAAPRIEKGPGRRAVVAAAGAGGVDAVVVGGDGRVRVRLSGFESVALPGAAGGDLLGLLEAALR